MADNGIAIKLKINGREVAGVKGQTVLEVCQASGVHVPTLCHCEGLKPVGGCRLCIVEIEGQRRLNTACTTPATDGMVVQTETPRLKDLRKRTVELLFSERNHICPFCPASGDCELQQAGYEHGMTHVRYDYLLPKLPIDNSHAYMALDHSRCILCSRCVRVCDEWVGRTRWTCRAAGRSRRSRLTPGRRWASPRACRAACAWRSARPGRCSTSSSNRTAGRQELPVQQTVCTACGLGCWTKVKTRGHTVLQIDSGHGPAGNPIICNRGRYDALKQANQPALQMPRLKKAADLVEVDWKAFAEELARRITSGRAGTDPSRVAAMVSPSLPLETIAPGAAVHEGSGGFGPGGSGSRLGGRRDGPGLRDGRQDGAAGAAERPGRQRPGGGDRRGHAVLGRRWPPASCGGASTAGGRSTWRSIRG